MLVFCPTCANLLTITSLPSTSPQHPAFSSPSNPSSQTPSSSSSSAPRNRLECRTCPYMFLIPSNVIYYDKRDMKRKEVDDVLADGGEGGGVGEVVEVQCNSSGSRGGEECKGSQAEFYQVQIRSADEPMTTFYKCRTCGGRWSEN